MNEKIEKPAGGAEAPKGKERTHKATYASDKKTGGYIIRVEGPQAAAFVGREVPVGTRDGVEHVEKLEKLIWTGQDKESGKPVALYKFASRPREAAVIEF